MDAGQLVPDELILSMVKERLSAPTVQVATSCTASRCRRRPRH